MAVTFFPVTVTLLFTAQIQLFVTAFVAFAYAAFDITLRPCVSVRAGLSDRLSRVRHGPG